MWLIRSLQSCSQRFPARFGVDHVSCISLLVATIAYQSYSSLYADLVRDALNEYMYAAELAGLNYNFAPATNGLYATMSGYNDKLSTLVQCVLEKVKTLSIDPHRLEVMREQVRRSDPYASCTCSVLSLVEQTRLG